MKSSRIKHINKSVSHLWIHPGPEAPTDAAPAITVLLLIERAMASTNA
jgi:hypothetical protein